MESKHKHFSVGQKVKLSSDGAFSKGITGLVSKAPSHVLSMSNGWIDNFKREFDTPKKGRKTFYWIVFDSPQFDEVGDGPYMEAEIEAFYLELIL